MHPSRPTARVVLVIIAITAISALPSQAAGAPAHDPNNILVGWEPSLSEADRTLVHAAMGAKVANRFHWIDVDVVQVPNGLTPTDLVERYERDGRARYAELNTLMQLHGTPNDPYFSSLWGLHNTGQSFGYTADADIDAPEGWDIGYGAGQFPNSGGIRVGVIDSGISSTHTEFSGGKIKACVRATSGAGTITNGTCPDDVGHGTHVAGTIAAHANNSAGIAGVAPASELAIAKTCTSAGCYQSDSIAALYWLRTTGAVKVVNMSFGSSSYNSSFASAVQDAYNAGVLLVASAGNSGSSTLNYPAAYGPVISVAALEPNNARAYFSNYNSDVELIAPGVDIRSTIPTNSYGYKSGTSMASPHVAGVGALVMAASGADNATARNLMNSTAVDLGSSGRDIYHGYGRVNLADSLNASPLKPVITSPGEGASFNTTQITVSGTGKSGRPLEVREGAAVLASTTVNAGGAWSVGVTLGEGTHQLTAVIDPGTSTQRTSDPRTVSVDTVAPAAPVITAPYAGEVVPTTSVPMEGSAEAGATILLSESGTQIGTTTADGSGSWATTVGLSEGAHTVDAAAKDAATNVGPSTSVSFEVTVPPVGPTVLTPLEGEHILDGSAVEVSGTSTDAAAIRIYEGAAQIGSTTPASDGTWSVVLSFADGGHTILATVVDTEGYESSPTKRSFLTGSAPVVTLSTPEEGSFNPGTVQITGQATPNALVRIYEDGNLIATGSSNASGAFSVAKPMGEGPHTITARAEVSGVLGGPTPPRQFIVDVREPILTVYNSDPYVALPTRNPSFAGFVSDDTGLDRVHLEFTRINGAPPAPRDADCPMCASELEADWEADLGNLPAGYYTAVIRAFDKVGNPSRPRVIRFVTT